MYKISITGQANTGKNTLAKLISKELNIKTQYIAFADPIKEMIKIMFPNLPNHYLYGSSKFRKKIIPNAFKGNEPLSVRQCLIDLGTEVGRSYNKNIWIDNFDYKIEKAKKRNIPLVIVTDVRFRNEFDHIRQLDFFKIKLYRETDVKINHSSETNQNEIKDEEFDFICNNNGTLKDLKAQVMEIIDKITNK